MVEIKLKIHTLAVLIAGLYTIQYDMEVGAIPESVFLNIAEQLEQYLPIWNYDIISFEDWIATCLMIYPKVLLSDELIADLQESTLYWEVPNGNVVLCVSMDVGVICEK